MFASDPKLSSIVDLHFEGMTSKKIARTLTVPLITVYRSIKLFKTTGGTVDRAHSGRPFTAVTRRNIEKIQKSIQRNPKWSMRNIAKEIGISERSFRTIVHEKLSIKNYKIDKSPGLTEANKKKRVQRCKELLKRTARNAHRHFVFCDEKLFTIE